MAINILTEQSDPPISGDYTLGLSIQHALEVPKLSILTSWESTASAPSAKQGAFLAHAGNTFQVQSSDESISGTPASGTNYIIATEDSGVITLAWTQDISDYSYSPAYGGVYDADGNQILRDICYLSDSAYYRGMGMGEDFNLLRLADGNLITGGGLTTTGDASIDGDLSVTGSLIVTGTIFDKEPEIWSSGQISVGETVLIPKGHYRFAYSTYQDTTTKGGAAGQVEIYRYSGSSLDWQDFGSSDWEEFTSDGAIFRINNDTTTSRSFHFYKW